MGRILLNIIILLSAIAAIYYQYIGSVQFYSILKPVTTILVILIAVVFGKKEVKKYFYSTVIALVFCLLGDVLLLNNSYFIYGLVSFLVAHILFAYGFISLGGVKLYKLPLLILLCVGVMYYYFIFSGLKEMYSVVAIYILVIVFMCWQGVCLYIKLKKTIFFLISIAVSLFLISDAILAYDKFMFSFKYSGALILSTYWLAIAILANATFYIDKAKLWK